jgi:hypothetical protein
VRDDAPCARNQHRGECRGPQGIGGGRRIKETQFSNLPEGFALRPGMRAVCDLKIGRRSILEYVLNPIIRVIGESLREP